MIRVPIGALGIMLEVYSRLGELTAMIADAKPKVDCSEHLDLLLLFVYIRHLCGSYEETSQIRAAIVLHSAI